MSDTPSASVVSREEQLGRIADEYARRLERGERPDIEEYAAEHPELAGLLRTVLPTIHLMNELSGDGGEASADEKTIRNAQSLGDFRLLRELGRGGMGVVYEAEQLSLGRRVAIKVLPFASTMDPRHLQRFKNEAMAAACLDHPHIVDVYGVGCERGVHFYAMRLIDGRTLAEVIAQLRELTKQRRAMPDSISGALSDGAEAGPRPSEEATAEYRPAGGTKQPVGAEPGANRPTAETKRVGGPTLASRDSTFTAGYFRSIAELTMHVAEALHHAHQEGIIHRDIKPSNLMMDSWGKVWVTDFGLAHVESNSNLTLTGDLVGTLRYMSPEQALARRVQVDHRTDVYSLGVTLYELLTLQPAFDGEDRQELLRQVCFEDPTPPQRINRSIPTDLATVALKALEKNPADRYGSAKDLADDLRRYLDDEPIRAKQPSLAQLGRKWVKRHPAFAISTCVMLLTLLIGGGGAWGYFTLRDMARSENAGQRAREHLDRAEEMLKKSNAPDSLGAILQAEELLGNLLIRTDLRRRANGLRADMKLVEKLEQIRTPAEFSDVNLGNRLDSELPEVFREIGIDVDRMSVADVVARIREHSVAVQIALVLDFWAIDRKHRFAGQGSSSQATLPWKHLLEISREVDPDPWRNRLRAALCEEAGATLTELVDLENLDKFSPVSLDILGAALGESGHKEQALNLLRRALTQYPEDFWLTYHLSLMLEEWEQGNKNEAIRYLTAALALRPKSEVVQNNLGVMLANAGKQDEAIAIHRQMLETNPRCLYAIVNLSLELSSVRPEEAEVLARKAIEMNPRSFLSWHALGIFQDRQELSSAGANSVTVRGEVA